LLRPVELAFARGVGCLFSREPDRGGVALGGAAQQGDLTVGGLAEAVGFALSGLGDSAQGPMSCGENQVPGKDANEDTGYAGRNYGCSGVKVHRSIPNRPDGTG